MRVLRRAWSRELRPLPPREVIRLAIQLLDHPGPWSRLVGYELIAHHPGGIQALTPAALRRLSTGLADWGSVDAFACYLSGPAWREGRLPTRQVHAWLRSPDRWLRRTAVVSTVALNVPARGGHGDTARTLAVCRQVVDDRDDMVEKALSWALRSLAPRDPREVARFVARHNDELSARVRREVGTKLRTGRKVERRRTGVAT